MKLNINAIKTIEQTKSNDYNQFRSLKPMQIGTS
jgi:hypothetical protein